jgi:hypothetical protein
MQMQLDTDARKVEPCRLLIATHVKFWLENQGSRRRIAALLKYLLENEVAVHLYYAGYVKENDLSEIARYKGLTFYADNVPGSLFWKKQVKRTLSSLCSRLSRRLDCGTFQGRLQPKGFSGKYAFHRKSYFHKLADSVKPDVILIEYIALAYLIEDLLGRQTRPELVVDTHDVLHLRGRSFADAGLSHWVDISRDEEVAYLEVFDAIVAIQGVEQAYLQELLPGKVVIRVPHPYKVSVVDRVPGDSVTIGYVGADNPVNRDAIAGFLAQVWRPLYERYGKKVRLEIHGTICSSDELFKGAEGVTLCGHFTDYRSAYAKLDIAVNPVSSGGGSRSRTSRL